jgi:uncharacterized protein (DUF1330 family)
MSYYFIASIRIKDEQEYQKYIDHVDEVFQKFKGTYLVVDNSPMVLEGSWDYTRSVVIRFEAREDFDSWYSSEEYQTILKHRLAGAVCDTILVKGLEK